MMYTLGLLTGLVISLIIFVIQMYLYNRNKNVINKIEERINKYTKVSGAIISEPIDIFKEFDEKL